MVVMRAGIEGIRPDRITFGTDYPYEFRNPEDAKGYIKEIKSLKVPKEVKQQILGQNVLNLFKIR